MISFLEIVLEKVLYNLWPEDVIHDRLRWNPEKIAPWTAVELLQMHLRFHQITVDWRNKVGIDKHIETDVMTKVHEIIISIFDGVVQRVHERFQLEVEGSTDSPDCGSSEPIRPPSALKHCGKCKSVSY